MTPGGGTSSSGTKKSDISGTERIDAVGLEIPDAGGVQHLVVDAELPGEFPRRPGEDRMGGIAHDLGRAAGAHHGVAAEEIADRGGGDGGARPQRVDRDAGGFQFAGRPSTHMLMPNLAIV